MAEVFGNKKLTIQQVKQVDGQFKNISEVSAKEGVINVYGFFVITITPLYNGHIIQRVVT